MQSQQNNQSGKSLSFDNVLLESCRRVSKGPFRPLYDRISYTSVGEVLVTARPGDLLDFDRGLYSHYALYLGQEKVMNVCAKGKNTEAALIRVMSIHEVCLDSKVRVRNHDSVAIDYFDVRPRSLYEILRAARSYEYRVVPYEFKFRNCEYYSTLWRYGKGFSTQVANFVMTPKGFIVDAVMSADIVSSILLTATEQLSQHRIYGKYLELSTNHYD